MYRLTLCGIDKYYNINSALKYTVVVKNIILPHLKINRGGIIIHNTKKKQGKEQVLLPIYICIEFLFL